MTTGTETTPKRLMALSGEELVKLIDLVGSADSVELKATLSTGEQQRAMTALGLDPLDAQIRQVFFFDTPDLQLNRAGVVLRARRIKGRDGDAIVKLRPVVPHDLPESIRRSQSVTVEVDAMPGGYVCSATMKTLVPNARVRETIAGTRPLRKLFTKEQRAFIAAHAPDSPEPDDLRVLGPVFVLKAVVVPEEFPRRVVAELWLLPDGSRIVELSTKCPPRKALRVAAEARAFLEGIGLEMVPDPHTKTKAALAFFAERMAAAE
jgi:hypothetical protein